MSSARRGIYVPVSGGDRTRGAHFDPWPPGIELPDELPGMVLPFQGPLWRTVFSAFGLLILNSSFKSVNALGQSFTSQALQVAQRSQRDCTKGTGWSGAVHPHRLVLADFEMQTPGWCGGCKGRGTEVGGVGGRRTQREGGQEAVKAAARDRGRERGLGRRQATHLQVFRGILCFETIFI